MIKNWYAMWVWMYETTLFNLALLFSLPKFRTNYFAYFKTVNKHRWFVFQEARKLGIPFLGLIHDWSKYLPSEFIPYARYFNGGYARGEQPDDVKLAFDFAWLHHQRWNKHHWQSYVLHNDQAECPKWAITYKGWDIRGNCESLIEIEEKVMQILSPFPHEELVTSLVREMSRLPKALPMPDRYRREMLADWRGAGRAYGNTDTRGGYLKNREGIILHPETRVWVEDQLRITGHERYNGIGHYFAEYREREHSLY